MEGQSSRRAAAGIRRRFLETEVHQLLRRDFPSLTTWFREEPATIPEFETVLHKVLRWYEQDTNYSLSAGGLLHVHPRLLQREFILRALGYTSRARMMRTDVRTGVEFRLRFRIRESRPTRVRIGGRLRLVIRREAHESLLEIEPTCDPNGVDEEAGLHEYGNYVCLWTEMDMYPDGQDYNSNVFMSQGMARIEFPNPGDSDATSCDGDGEDAAPCDDIDEDTTPDQLSAEAAF